ncbi:UNVERIFIED_CONTAM: hypothetical protein Sangu_0159000 [Sesamum angustifolium]|uniref:SWIM-type domain-containing protein n=1 Tax=Sesamum angustifolium TaxID=2727405 RepID=A0AAW2RLG4_9LAMI
MTGYVSIDIFVQAEKIREMVVPDDPAVSEWGTYMSMLTQELSSVPVVTQSMGRFGINDDYPGPSSYASPSDYAGPSSFAGPSDYAGTSSPAGPSVSSEQDDEPEADSMLNNEHVDSEPDEVEVEGLTTNNPENNDEVSIEVMIDVLGNTASGPRSQRQDHFDLNMPVSCEPTNLYSVIPFFEAMHPEVPADSIDIPTGAWGNFYDSNTGELAIGMVSRYDCHTFVGDGSSRPAYDIKFVQQNVKDRFGFEISYHKAWQSLKAAREQVYGTWESSVKKLPRFMAFLQKLNPGTVVEWLNLETDRPGVQMLHYVFWAFRPCIEGFRSCRNVISVDGTHLYTKYKHKLLVAVTLDANQQVLPLAFALVDEESLASWRWFLQMLAKHLLPNDDDRVCLISDRHSGLISAINYVPAFKFPRGVHRFCLRHFYFLERTTRCHRMLNANQEWADFAFRIFEARQAEAGSHTYVVKLKHKTCSCGKWGTHGIPCSHAIQVSRHFGVNASNFIPQYYSIRAYRKTYQGRFEPLYGEEYWIPLTLNLCIIRRSEFAEDQADMFRRGYQMKWIDHKHVLANNINLVKFRINCHNVDVVCSDGDEYPAALLWACLNPSHQMALVRSQDVFVSLDGCYVQSLQRKMAYSKCKHMMDQWE